MHTSCQADIQIILWRAAGTCASSKHQDTFAFISRGECSEGWHPPRRRKKEIRSKGTHKSISSRFKGPPLRSTVSVSMHGLLENRHDVTHSRGGRGKKGKDIQLSPFDARTLLRTPLTVSCDWLPHHEGEVEVGKGVNVVLILQSPPFQVSRPEMAIAPEHKTRQTHRHMHRHGTPNTHARTPTHSHTPIRLFLCVL